MDFKNLALETIQAEAIVRGKHQELCAAKASLVSSYIALTVTLCDGNDSPSSEDQRHVAIVLDDAVLDCVWDDEQSVFTTTLIPRL